MLQWFVTANVPLLAFIHLTSAHQNKRLEHYPFKPSTTSFNMNGSVYANHLPISRVKPSSVAGVTGRYSDKDNWKKSGLSHPVPCALMHVYAKKLSQM